MFSVKFFDDLKSHKKEFLENLYIGIQKTSDKNVVKKDSDLDGIEEYLYLKAFMDDSTFGNVSIEKNILDYIEISENTAWEVAEINTFSITKVMTMYEVIQSAMGLFSSPELEDEDIGRVPMYILTNEFKNRGASAILDKKALANVGKKLGTHKLIVLPSSIHEMIVLPYTDDEAVLEYAEGVKKINESVVAFDERLTDQAYVITI